MIKKLIPFAMVADITLVLGTGGAYENDVINNKQFIVMLIIYFTAFFVLDHVRNKKAFSGCNHKKAHRK